MESEGSRLAPQRSPMFVNACYDVWMTDGEFEILQRAIKAVREGAKVIRSTIGSAGRLPEATSDPPMAITDCLEALLDEFLHAYEDEALTMRERYPLFERDGWRCRVPGCRAHGPLHLHHIVFRAHGGSDEPDNLVSLCAFHHKALHDGWIRCVGRAPVGLYWELGIERRDGLGAPPVARVAGARRLAPDEYWDGAGVRRLDPEGV